MDFAKVLPLVIDAFKKENVHYALMGGFSMGAVGVMRATMDLDFLIDNDDRAKVEGIMKKFGYRSAFKSENVSQYVGAIKGLGEIDYLHAMRTITRSMLDRARELPVLGGRCSARVLLPEDIIGLKVQASVNDPTRKTRDLADIESIMKHFGKKLDWALLKEYFSLFKLDQEYKDLRKRYDNA